MQKFFLLALLPFLFALPPSSAVVTLDAVAGAHCHPPSYPGDDWTADSGYYAFGSFGVEDVDVTVSVNGERTGGTPGFDSATWTPGNPSDSAETWQNGPYPADKFEEVYARASANAGGPGYTMGLMGDDAPASDQAVGACQPDDGDVETPDVPGVIGSEFLRCVLNGGDDSTVQPQLSSKTQVFNTQAMEFFSVLSLDLSERCRLVEDH